MSDSKIYLIAMLLREESLLHAQIRAVQALLSDANISFEKPKMKLHITFASPFYLDEEKASWVAAALEFASVVNKDLTSQFLFDTVDHYNDEGNQTATLILRFNPRDEVIRGTVERLRAFISKSTSWRFLPESMLVNFHLTIAQGVPSEKIHLAKDIAKGVKFDPLGEVAGPFLCRKESEYWAPVRI